MADDDEQKPIIVKKVKKGGHGHHGGAWKVAYADFVTAMMAFFLLLWLLNVTTEEQKNAISNYFDPTAPKVSESQSGAGGVLGGLSVASEGARVSNKRNLARPKQTTPRQHSMGQKIQKGDSQNQADRDGQAAQIAQLREAEDKRFEAASQKLKAAMEKDEELAKLSENLRVDITPEGMRIQIVDREGEAMFPVGSAKMYDKTRNLMGKVADAVKDMPNDISVRGHTDAQPYNPGSDFTNWELSSARAHSSRRALLEDGVMEDRIANVVGKADTDLLLPDEPENPKNRRISIVLLREKLEDAEGGEGGADQDGARTGTPRGRAPVEREPAYERTKGEVQFP